MEHVMVFFLEENWAAFVRRCEEAGYTKQDAEKRLEKLLREGDISGD
jgi:hypothetical protein